MFLCYTGDVYLWDDIRVMKEIFDYCTLLVRRDYGVRINQYRFLESFLNSDLREHMDLGYPRAFGRSGWDNLNDFIDTELKGNLRKFAVKKGSEDWFKYWNGQMEWVGWMYAYIHYKTKLSMRYIYKKLNLKEMCHQYITGHQMSFGGAFDKIKPAFESELKLLKEKFPVEPEFWYTDEGADVFPF